MKKVVALIDFTPISNLVANFARNLAKEKHVEITFVHVDDEEDSNKLEQNTEVLKSYVKSIEEAGEKAIFEIHKGSFFSIIAPIIKNHNPDLVLIGTHGKKGLMQNIFGSHILKLVQMVGKPSLVIQENTEWPENGFVKVLSPISSHDNFNIQIKQTKTIIEDDGEIDIYAIHKTEKLEEASQKNLLEGKQLLIELGIRHKIVEEDVKMFSVGYAKQTIAFLEKNPSYYLISIMSQISEASKYFGEMDKENIILNPLGLPVLCCE